MTQRERAAFRRIARDHQRDLYRDKQLNRDPDPTIQGAIGTDYRIMTEVLGWSKLTADQFIVSLRLEIRPDGRGW